MAAWQKGQSGNPKGRPKGAKGQFTQITQTPRKRTAITVRYT